MVMKKHGQERLGQVAKLHFKTTQADQAGLAYTDSPSSKSFFLATLNAE